MRTYVVGFNVGIGAEVVSGSHTGERTNVEFPPGFS